MKLNTKYLLFFMLTLVSSLGIFVGLTVNIYSKDKISFVKERATQEVMSLANQVSSEVKAHGPSVIYENEFQNLFERDDLANKFLVDKHGLILAGEAGLQGKNFSESVSLQALSRINLTESSSGLIEGGANDGAGLLIGYANVPDTDQFVLQTYRTSQLKRFLLLFLVKVGFAFLALGSFFLLVGYLAVGQFTRGLEALSSTAEKFGGGLLDERVEVRGNDEVATVSRQFNKMAVKIKESLKLEEEKTRLKLEMKTAQKVQELLFLPNSFSNGRIEIQGYYEPASECSGDWWYYFAREDSMWICIGDVTGHGVGSAMLTSSVRAALSIIEKDENLTPAIVLQRLNQVIYSTVGGKLQMTFFVVQIFDSGSRIKYANASHEFPMLVPKGKQLKRQEIESLMDANGPRLGESPISKYREKEIEISTGSRLLLYSDGIFDVSSPDEKDFGERGFIKSLLKTNATSNKPSAVVEDILHDLREHRASTALVDDVSLLCVDVD